WVVLDQRQRLPSPIHYAKSRITARAPDVLVGEARATQRLRHVFKVRGTPERQRPDEVLDRHRSFRAQFLDGRRRVALTTEAGESGGSVRELVGHTNSLASEH